MSGHRKVHGRPKRADATPERQRQHIQQRLNSEGNPRKRMSIAFDYLRMCLGRAGSDADRIVADQVVQTLLTLAERAGLSR